MDSVLIYRIIAVQSVIPKICCSISGIDDTLCILRYCVWYCLLCALYLIKNRKLHSWHFLSLRRSTAARDNHDNVCLRRPFYVCVLARYVYVCGFNYIRIITFLGKQVPMTTGVKNGLLCVSCVIFSNVQFHAGPSNC